MSAPRTVEPAKLTREQLEILRDLRSELTAFEVTGNAYHFSVAGRLYQELGAAILERRTA